MGTVKEFKMLKTCQSPNPIFVDYELLPTSWDIHRQLNGEIDMQIWNFLFPVRFVVNTKLRTMEE